jgi:hypothetical protein
VRILFGFVVALLVQSPVWAQNAPAPVRPWAQGVDEATQVRALKIFEEANELFAQDLHAQAAKKYKQALEIWDHPSIRRNLSETQIYLGDRILEALENLESALQYGDAPLGKQIYKRALLQKRLLEGQVATVEIISDQEGIVVSLDGDQLFVGPGKKSKRVLPGRHLLLSEKKGFISQSEELSAFAKSPISLTVELERLVTKQFTFKRRWASWVPWTVAGSGLALAATGGILMATGNSNIADFDKQIDELCPSSCPVDQPEVQDLLGKKDTAETTRTAGVIILGVGAAAVIAGTVLLVLNQPQEIPADEQPRVSVSFSASDSGFGLVLSGRL